jgi:hypothetical protein
MRLVKENRFYELSKKELAKALNLPTNERITTVSTEFLPFGSDVVLIKVQLK